MSMVPWTLVAVTWLFILMLSVPVSRLQFIVFLVERARVKAMESIMQCGAGKNWLVGRLGLVHTSVPSVEH